jgi:hypothetical protein
MMSLSLITAPLLGDGIDRLCFRLKEENRDKVINYIEDAYGIFQLAEFVMLLGQCVTAFPPKHVFCQSILARDGLSLKLNISISVQGKVTNLIPFTHISFS